MAGARQTPLTGPLPTTAAQPTLPDGAFGALQVPGSVVGEVLEGEIVLLNMATGLYFGLNRVGTMIWKSIAQDGNLERAIASVTHAYPQADAGAVRSDAELLVAQLLEKGLLRIQSAPATSEV